MVILSTSAFSQEQKIQKTFKVGFINTYDYLDDKKGIKELASAVELAQRTCSHTVIDYGASDLSKSIIKTSEELKNKNLSQNIRQKKENEFIELSKLLQEEWNACYDRQKKFSINPLEEKIKFIIEEIAKFNNLKIIDINSDTFNSFLYFNFNSNLEITDQVIETVNNFFTNKTLSQTTINLPVTKIVTLQTKLLKNSKEYAENVSEFAKINKYDVIFDANTNLSKEIIEIIIKDVTEELITFVKQKKSSNNTKEN